MNKKQTRIRPNYYNYSFHYYNCIYFIHTNTSTTVCLGHGADITFEADSGYSPVALAIALGYKKSKYP